MTSIAYFGASDVQTIRIRKFFWGNWALEASEVPEVAEVNDTGEVSKAWKITFVDFRVFQVIEFHNFRTNTGTPPLTRFSYTAVFYLTRFFLGQKPR